MTQPLANAPAYVDDDGHLHYFWFTVTCGCGERRMAASLTEAVVMTARMVAPRITLADVNVVTGQRMCALYLDEVAS